MQEPQQDEAESPQQTTSEHHEQAPSVDTKEKEPNLFDILEEEVSDIGEEDPIDDERVDLTGHDILEG